MNPKAAVPLCLALERALANSRDLRAATLRVREAGATSDIQRAARLPVVNGSVEATRALAQVAQLEQARAQQHALLDLLVGTPVTLAPLTRELAPGRPSDLLLERPDIAAAEHAPRAAEARARAYPTSCAG